MTENSAFSQSASQQNFTLRGAAKLKHYKDLISHWEITNLDYEEVMQPDNDNTFCFLDPPYKIGSYLYGTNAEMHKDFDHNRFAEVCKKCPNDWMVTYNVDEEIEKMFGDFHQRYFSITYGMQHRENNKKSELLISNYDVNPPSTLESALYGQKV